MYLEKLWRLNEGLLFQAKWAIFQQYKSYIWIEFEFLEFLEFLVFNTTFSNISVISWRPVLVVEEATGKLYHLRCESSAPFFAFYKAGREPTPYWW